MVLVRAIIKNRHVFESLRTCSKLQKSCSNVSSFHLYVLNYNHRIGNAYVTRNRASLVKCFAMRFDCSRFTSIVLRNLDMDKCIQNPCRVMKQSMAGRKIPTMSYFTWQWYLWPFVAFYEVRENKVSPTQPCNKHNTYSKQRTSRQQLQQHFIKSRGSQTDTVRCARRPTFSVGDLSWWPPHHKKNRRRSCLNLSVVYVQWGRLFLRQSRTSGHGGSPCPHLQDFQMSSWLRRNVENKQQLYRTQTAN